MGNTAPVSQRGKQRHRDIQGTCLSSLSSAHATSAYWLLTLLTRTWGFALGFPGAFVGGHVRLCLLGAMAQGEPRPTGVATLGKVPYSGCSPGSAGRAPPEGRKEKGTNLLLMWGKYCRRAR